MRHDAVFRHGSSGPGMQNPMFEAVLGIATPWYVRGVDFDAERKVLTIGIDLVARVGLPRRGSKGCIGSMTPRPSG
jgi:hypothetical protein